VWKDIRGFENMYQVNEYGEVKSVERYVSDRGGLRIIHERILKPCLCGKGYLRVCLRKDNKTYELYNHRLVAEAFVDNPNNNNVVNHKDGNKTNNYYENIEWVTYSENNIHAYATNLKPRGEGLYSAKLKESEVIEVLTNGKYAPYREIGKKYGVSAATIRDVLIRRTWQYINI